jgi:hypothetical protein
MITFEGKKTFKRMVKIITVRKMLQCFIDYSLKLFKIEGSFLRHGINPISEKIWDQISSDCCTAGSI